MTLDWQYFIGGPADGVRHLLGDNPNKDIWLQSNGQGSYAGSCIFIAHPQVPSVHYKLVDGRYVFQGYALAKREPK